MAEWDDEVRPVTVGDLGKLQIDSKHKLYYDGKAIRLSAPLQVAALVGVVGAVLGGIGSVASAIISYNYTANYIASLSASPSRELVERSYNDVSRSLRTIESELAKITVTVASLPSENAATAKSLQGIAPALERIVAKIALVPAPVPPPAPIPRPSQLRQR